MPIWLGLTSALLHFGDQCLRKSKCFMLRPLRRPKARPESRLDGPGIVAQALALDTSDSHHPLFEEGGLELHRGDPPKTVIALRRVGIGYATKEDHEPGLLETLSALSRVVSSKIVATDSSASLAPSSI